MATTIAITSPTISTAPAQVSSIQGVGESIQIPVGRSREFASTMSRQNCRNVSDVPNLDQIKQSKLFKKFLATDQSDDGARSGENTCRGFQESPFVSHANIIGGGGATAGEIIESNVNGCSNNLQRSNVLLQQSLSKFPRGSMSGQQLASNQNNMNLRGSSNESKQSHLNMSNVSGISNFQHISHSYFQPPTPQYATNTTANDINFGTHTAAELSPNISQYVLDNHKKQHFSPERFYFNAAANQNQNMNHPQNAHTILEDDREINGQSSNYSRTYPNVAGVPNTGTSTFSNSKHFQMPGSPPPFNSEGSNQLQYIGGVINGGGLVTRMNDDDSGRTHLYTKTPQQVQQQPQQQHQFSKSGFEDETEGGTSTNVPGSVLYTEKKRGPMFSTNLRSSKSTFMAMSQDPRVLEQDWRNMQEQLFQYEGNAQHLSQVLEQEMMKNHALEEQIGNLKSSLAVASTSQKESEKKLKDEVEKLTKEIDGLKKNVSENEQRILEERTTGEKVKARLDESIKETNKSEEQLRNAQNAIKQHEEAAIEFKRRQEKRDDEVIGLKLQHEQLQAKYATLSLGFERASEKLDSSQRSQLREVEEKEESSRRIQEQSVKLQNFLVESERLKNENYSLNRQLHESAMKQEMMASELAYSKQQAFERQTKDSLNAVSIDRANFEIHNLRNLLARTELELREVKGQNSHLLKNIQNISLTNALSASTASSVSNGMQYDLVGAAAAENNNQPRQLSHSTSVQGIQPQQLYQRGRAEQLIERSVNNNNDSEEFKMNSPDRLRFKPRDNNIFGNSSAADVAQRPAGYTSSRLADQQLLQYSPQGAKADMIRPRDHNVFGVNVDDTYQRNPMKIGHASSLSPQRTVPVGMIGSVGAVSEIPPAGQRKRSLNHADGQTATHNNSSQRFYNGGVQKSNPNILESNLALMYQDRTILESELRKIEDMKRKTGADIRRKTEISRELESLETLIAEHRTQLRNAAVASQ